MDFFLQIFITQVFHTSWVHTRDSYMNIPGSALNNFAYFAKILAAVIIEAYGKQ